MQRQQRLVDDPVIGKHRLEQAGIGDQRGNAGQEQDGPEQAAEAQRRVVERHCK
ncbi:hypothetical protein D3C71_2121630 [compost metagenome]